MPDVNANPRPDRPYLAFPLTAHKSGQWKKRIAGKDFYFGRWYDSQNGRRWGSLSVVDPTGRMWKAAVEEYNTFARRQAEEGLLAAKSSDVALETLANAYLNAEHDRLDTGDIKPRTYEGHRDALKRMLNGIGRDKLIRDLDEEEDLRTIKTYLADMRTAFAAWTYNRHVRSLRAMFRWAVNPIDGVLVGPLRLHGALRMIGTRIRRREQREARAAAGGRRMPTVPELRALHAAAPPRLRACYLLAFFAAYGQGDCAELTTDVLQFEPPAHLGLPPGWALIHFPRPKSEIDRACVVPPIVVQALRDVLAARPTPARPALANRVFLTESGEPACYDSVRRDADSTVQSITRVDNVKQWHAATRARVRTCAACGLVPAKRFMQGDAWFACPTCGLESLPLRPIGFYTIRHASITLTAGCDETARLLHEGHILPGVRPEYVEGVGVDSMVKIGQTLLDHWTGATVTTLVGGSGHAPSPPPASASSPAPAVSPPPPTSPPGV